MRSQYSATETQRGRPAAGWIALDQAAKRELAEETEGMWAIPGGLKREIEGEPMRGKCRLTING